MQEHFKIPTDGKVTSSPLRKCLLPLVFAKITRAEFSSEEGSDNLKRSEMSKNKGKGKDLDCKARYCDSRVGFHLRFPALEVAFRKSGGCPCGHSLSCPPSLPGQWIQGLLCPSCTPWFKELRQGMAPQYGKHQFVMGSWSK